MIINKEIFGDFLASARNTAGLSQLDLARKLGYSSPQYVSNWERGICGPPLDKLYELSTTLNISANTLLTMIMEETEAYLRNELRLSTAKAPRKARAGRR